MSSFINFLNAIQPLSEGLTEAILASAVREQLPAHHLLLQPAQVARRFYFLETGLVRGATLLHGREVSSWFMQE